MDTFDDIRGLFSNSNSYVRRINDDGSFSMIYEVGPVQDLVFYHGKFYGDGGVIYSKVINRVNDAWYKDNCQWPVYPNDYAIEKEEIVALNIDDYNMRIIGENLPFVSGSAEFDDYRKVLSDYVALGLSHFYVEEDINKALFFKRAYHVTIEEVEKKFDDLLEADLAKGEKIFVKRLINKH